MEAVLPPRSQLAEPPLPQAVEAQRPPDAVRQPLDAEVVEAAAVAVAAAVGAERFKFAL